MPILQQVARLTGKDARALHDALHQTARLKSTSALCEQIASALPSLSEPDIEAIVSDLFAQTALAGAHNWTIEDVVTSVAADPNLNLSEAQSRKLRERLLDILQSPAVVGLARAMDVAREHEKALHTARIITDIRPVFAEEIDQEPLGAVVLHTLRLEYSADMEMQTIALAVSHAHLEVLKATISRAEQKAAAAASLLERADLTAYEVIEVGEA